eukprot:GHVS01100263.1.p1 GENE.GHVS01100263.1~~GHVS01100263.1.p1  ORF type:complete len:124 (-),score=8.17 GHVS01100263.1:155-526(-)
MITVSFEQLDEIPTRITVSCDGKDFRYSTWEKPQLQFEVVLYDSKGFRGFYVPVWDGLSLGQIKIVTKTNEVESTSVVVGWEQVMRKEWRKTQRRDPDVYGEMVTTRGGKKQYRYTFRINEGH